MKCVKTTQKLDKNDPKWQEVLPFYNAKEIVEIAIGTLLNVLITNQRKIFLLSRNILIEMIEQDSNNSRKQINGPSYKTFINFVTRAGLIKPLVPPSKFGSSKRRAGMYELTAPEILEFIQVDPEKEAEMIREYNATNQIT